jgi:hypothetical protein
MFSFFCEHRVITAIIGLAVLIRAWYLFRPELLFISKSVNEAPPFDATAQPLDTGLFSRNLHETSGRATIYRQPNGVLILRLSDFHTSNGPNVHVVLAMPNDPMLQSAATRPITFKGSPSRPGNAPKRTSMRDMKREFIS